MWFVFLAGMSFGSDAIASAAKFAFWGIALLHVGEFFAKKSVMEKAGGPLLEHFVQTMIYGLFHWKPLQEAQQAGDAGGNP